MSLACGSRCGVTRDMITLVWFGWFRLTGKDWRIFVLNAWWGQEFKPSRKNYAMNSWDQNSDPNI